MEIKTTEHYVVARLQEMEEKNKELENQVDTLLDKVAHLTSVIQSVKEDLVVRETHNPDGHYVNMNSVWEHYDSEKYEWYIKTFNLDVPPLTVYEDKKEHSYA